MKYSNYIGVLAALLLVATCFVPWVYIQSLDLTITGFYSKGTYYGKPGLMNVFLCSVAILCFLVPKIGAKRTNLFICAFNLAWCIKNFLVISQCQQGECPEKLFGIYAIVFLSIVMMVMSLIPKVKLS